MRHLLPFLLFVASSADAYELKRDSTGHSASWKSPLHFILDEQLASRLEAEGSPGAVRAALTAVGEATPGLLLSASSGKSHGVGYDFDHPEASTSDVLAPEEWKWNVNAVATTVITINRATHQIIEADVAFNVKHTRFAVIGAGQPSLHYDVQNAMTHELGHAVGLAHNDLPNTVMFPSSAPGEISKRILAADDLEGLRFLYGRGEANPEVPVQGCSAAGSGPLALAALLMGGLFRRRRLLVMVAAVLGVLAFVAPVFAGTPAVQPAWTVTSVNTLPPGPGPAVLESEVTFARGGQLQTIRLPGGRWGQLEQVVEGFAVPTVGERFHQLVAR